MELRLIIHSATDRRSSGRWTKGRFTEKKIKREKGRENEAERKWGKERDRKRNKTACYICISYSNIRRCFEEFSLLLSSSERWRGEDIKSRFIALKGTFKATQLRSRGKLISLFTHRFDLPYSWREGWVEGREEIKSPGNLFLENYTRLMTLDSKFFFVISV